MAIRKKLTILGSGSAGLTAAIYAARANLEPLVIQGLQAGGQLTITSDVENFPGFPNGILGPELMEEMHKQAERFGTQFIYDNAEYIDLTKRPFTIRTSAEEIITDTLIIGTGASAKLLGLESESKLMGHGVSACATCDGFFFRDKTVFVVGGGDTALEEATFLTRFASSVTVVHRRDGFRASAIMVDRAKQNEKVKFILNSVVEDINDVEKGEVTSIKLRNIITNEVQELPADGVFIAIGHQPNTELFKGQIELTETGYVVTDGVKTSVKGVFAAGDVQDELYRQAITAAGTGCMAALEAQWLLENEEAENHGHDQKKTLASPVANPS
ncbi:MAG: thioredoxin-disulfide reductase [Cyanobacteria bacterium SZAS LIN-2]|nr:thioredoxin-disulfide reductase [Cyanobacteria bacterium SZAS LIN-3]MBS1996761.1 thioredoxin-disulfide reductase [Cyanobacteria bacterium SZAS LIN-2]MBS2007297.1 thioredoxin-disulfide reductase [Cyanobacteria bacterium SZAS TMP-1]